MARGILISYVVYLSARLILSVLEYMQDELWRVGHLIVYTNLARLLRALSITHWTKWLPYMAIIVLTTLDVIYLVSWADHFCNISILPASFCSRTIKRRIIEPIRAHNPVNAHNMDGDIFGGAVGLVNLGDGWGTSRLEVDYTKERI
ncbi:hypothetical protein K469DRAFT_681992 [Zopfia rhizophila CBS 207.26]|uniref:Uncharacterized protein n=1 Tax=Zopfia rhizophila CBS 207.26 TaxID=1314779 RepID=A0A6A6EXQ2_9PEZI|nr:hypothetical protein K469DRAFT_681992 [Zopfia rhizophila CBS 207.26]